MKACILTDFTLPSFVKVGELYAQTFEKLGWDVEHRGLDAGRDRLMGGYDIVFQNMNGRNFIPVEGCKNIAFFVHEWSHYPPAWIPYLDKFDALWTTTLHCKEIAERSGLKPPAYWIPPAMDIEPFPQKAEYSANAPFRFLYVGEWHFRKGLHLLFEAWQCAFPQIGEAHLTVKTSQNCPFESPRKDIKIIKEKWPRERLLQLYVNCDCYVSTSLGEGWGLPIIEAIQCGLPVCANLWGGHQSMLDECSCFPIQHEETPQPYASQPEFYAPGQACGFSDIGHIVDALQQAIHSDFRYRAKIAQSARHKIEQAYALASVIEKNERFKSLSN